MKFQKIPFIVASLFVLFSISSCDKDDKKDDDKAQPVFILEFKVKDGNENFIIKNGKFVTVNGTHASVQVLKFYLSNLKLENTDGEMEALKDVEYLDFSNNHSTAQDKGEQIIVSAKPGSYKGFHFDLGVDPSVNYSDPAVFDADHPLSINNGAHWSWNTGYIFTKLEGRYGTAPDALDNAYLFHTGLNDLFMPVTFTKDFLLNEGDTVKMRIEMEVKDLFATDGDVLDLNMDYFTHTTDNKPLGIRITTFLKNSMKLQ